MSDPSAPDQSVPDHDPAADVEIDLTAFLPEGVVIDARGDHGAGAGAEAPAAVASGVEPSPGSDEAAGPEGGPTTEAVDQHPTAPPSAEPPSMAPAEAAAEDIDVELLDAVEQDLDAVDAALRSLDDGSYGTCVVCRTELASDVLTADPVRRTCPDHG